jgi:hypothetical protein
MGVTLPLLTPHMNRLGIPTLSAYAERVRGK